QELKLISMKASLCPQNKLNFEGIYDLLNSSMSLEPSVKNFYLNKLIALNKEILKEDLNLISIHNKVPLDNQNNLNLFYTHNKIPLDNQNNINLFHTRHK